MHYLYAQVFNSQIIKYLLNRLRDFHEWGQCTVLDLVAKYTPTDQNEMFDIMNLLEDRLKHSNSAVVCVFLLLALPNFVAKSGIIVA